MNTLHAFTLAGLLMAAPLSATWAAGPNAAPARASNVLSGEVRLECKTLTPTPTCVSKPKTAKPGPR